LAEILPAIALPDTTRGWRGSLEAVPNLIGGNINAPVIMIWSARNIADPLS
jgi:hypothetical protein